MFAGLRLDTAMHEEVMRRRLRKLGTTVRAARSSAALQLAQTLPAAILADLLGVDRSTAEDWTQLANTDSARYAAAR
jgi:CheY-like chemotaxis protein